MKSENKTSRNLGIIGIIFSCIIPLVGVVLGIIGLSITKDKNHKDRDVVLNIISIVWGFVGWIIGWIILGIIWAFVRPLVV